MSEAIEAPLTLGQLSVWRDLAGMAGSAWPFITMGQSVPLPPGTTLPALHRALASLMDAHEVLRTRFPVHGTPAPAVQVIDPAGTHPVPFLTVGGDGPGGLIPETLHGIAVHTTDRVPWRAVLAGDDTEPRRVHLLMHRLTTDLQGLSLLAEDLVNTLAGGVTTNHRPTGPRTVLALENSEAGRSAAGRGLTRWQDGLTSAVLPPAPPAYRFVREGTLRSTELFAAVRHRAAADGVSVPVVLLHAFGAAVLETEELASCLFRNMVSNRFHPARRRVVTSMNQWSAMVLSREDHTPAGTAGHSVLAARDGVHDVYAVGRLIEECGRPVHTLDHAPSFNYVDESSSLDSDPGPASRSFTVSRVEVPVGPMFSLKAVRTGDLALTLRVPDVPGAREKVERLLTAVELGLLSHA